MDEALWALGRGTGVVALALLTLSMAIGIATRSGRPAAGLPRFGVARLHRSVALLATVFVTVHVVSLLFDSYAQLRVVDLVVPFVGQWRPFWLGLGTLAIDLVLAVVVTALLRHRIGPRAFRLVHLGTYALWPIALGHSLGSGTDAGTVWFLAFAGVCSSVVVGAVAWRLGTRFRHPTAAAPVPVLHGVGR